MPNVVNLEWAGQEFSGADLPNERSRANLYNMAASVLENPESSNASISS